jgi:hypothetical protein
MADVGGEGEPAVAPTADAAALLAATGGLLWGLALPDLAGVALAAVGAACSVRALTGRIGEDARNGLIFGLCWFGPAARWVPPALADYGEGDGWRVWGALVLLQAAPLGVVWALAGALRARAGLASLPLAWAALAEPVSALAPMPDLPSILYAGAPALLGPLRWGGEAAGCGAAVGIGAALAVAWELATAGVRGAGSRGAASAPPPEPSASAGAPGRSSGGGRGAGPAGWAGDGSGRATYLRGAWAAGFLACVVLLGQWPVEDGEPIRVGVVQPDTGAFDGRRASTADARRDKLLGHLAALDAAGVAFSTTPESAWPDAWRGEEAALSSLSAPVLLGVWVAGPGSAAVGSSGAASLPGAAAGGSAPVQAAVVVERGVERDRAEKIDLAPLSERRVGWWGHDRARAGEGDRIVGIAGRRVGVLLCFEDSRADAVRALARSDVELLVLPAVDAWTGDGPGTAWHLARAQVVAALTGRTVVRPTSSGVSAVIGPDGALRWSAPARDGDAGVLPGERAVIEVRARVPGWTGAGVGPYCGLGALVCALGVSRWRQAHC